MTTLAYNPAYDNYLGMSRSLSRRQTLAYGPSSLPYSQGVYTDPGMQTYIESPYVHSHRNALVPLSRRVAGASFEDLGDPYYFDERQPPPLIAPAPMTYPSVDMGISAPRHRRHSAVSFVTRPPVIDSYHRSNSNRIKFKRKGAFAAGITLVEAQSHTRLSNNDHYTLNDLHANSRGRILLKVRVCNAFHEQVRFASDRNKTVTISGMDIHP
ncbi:hypothetical protein AX17_001145 [Amanita inopinata Kibby_2008]|nr:hypothetical protein AX17_001145 [Amanita inopinata Kibby_2008]